MNGRDQLSQAVVLGAVQGPAELLPVSSSAHISLLPWLLGWDRDGIDHELQKSFEIALHTGAAAALLIGQREVVRDEIQALDTRTATVLLLSFLPAAVVGYFFERPIERHLGGPAATACGLVVGSAAMAAADHWPGRAARGTRRPARILRRLSDRFRGKPSAEPARAVGRGRGEADWRDGVALGVAQAAALAPGVSRNGATLAAARRRGFSRDQSNLLSRTVALPIITGATVLKAVRLKRRGIEPDHTRILVAGTVASFVSTLASQGLLKMVEGDRALWPYAAYRLALAGAIGAKLRRSRRP